MAQVVRAGWLEPDRRATVALDEVQDVEEMDLIAGWRRKQVAGLRLTPALDPTEMEFPSVEQLMRRYAISLGHAKKKHRELLAEAGLQPTRRRIAY